VNADGAIVVKQLQATLLAIRLPAGCAATEGGADRLHPMLIEPDVEDSSVEANEPPHLEERDPTLSHEPTNMAGRDTKDRGDLVRVEQRCSVHRKRGRPRVSSAHDLSNPTKLNPQLLSLDPPMR